MFARARLPLAATYDFNSQSISQAISQHRGRYSRFTGTPLRGFSVLKKTEGYSDSELSVGQFLLTL